PKNVPTSPGNTRNGWTAILKNNGFVCRRPTSAYIFPAVVPVNNRYLNARPPSGRLASARSALLSAGSTPAIPTAGPANHFALVSRSYRTRSSTGNCHAGGSPNTRSQDAIAAPSAAIIQRKRFTVFINRRRAYD